jgi:hypothetical protein
MSAACAHDEVGWTCLGVVDVDDRWRGMAELLLTGSVLASDEEVSTTTSLLHASDPTTLSDA